MEPAAGTRDILIQAADLEAAEALYGGVLGLPVFLREPSLIGLDAGGFRLFLDRGASSGPVLEFIVEDVQLTKAALIRAGCVVEQEDAAIPRCYIRDPHGVIINVAKR